MILVSVYDTKAKAHLNIATLRTPDEAIRQFEQASRDPKSQFAQFPSDFILKKLADYDEFSGEIKPCLHVTLATASEFSQPQS